MVVKNVLRNLFHLVLVDTLCNKQEVVSFNKRTVGKFEQKANVRWSFRNLSVHIAQLVSNEIRVIY